MKKSRMLRYANARLNKPLAERNLAIGAMKEIDAKTIVSAPTLRQRLRFAQAPGLVTASKFSNFTPDTSQ